MQRMDKASSSGPDEKSHMYLRSFLGPLESRPEIEPSTFRVCQRPSVVLSSALRGQLSHISH